MSPPSMPRPGWCCRGTRAPTASSAPWPRRLTARPSTLSATSPNGKPLPWKYHPRFSVTALVQTAATLFGGGQGSGGHISAWKLSNGARLWERGLDGNVEGLALVGGQLIAGGHFTHAGF